MAEEPGPRAWTINVQVGSGSEAEVKELVQQITDKVGEVTDQWQERMKQRDAAKLPNAPSL